MVLRSLSSAKYSLDLYSVSVVELRESHLIIIYLLSISSRPKIEISLQILLPQMRTLVLQPKAFLRVRLTLTILYSLKMHMVLLVDLLGVLPDLSGHRKRSTTNYSSTQIMLLLRQDLFLLLVLNKPRKNLVMFLTSQSLDRLVKVVCLLSVVQQKQLLFPKKLQVYSMYLDPQHSVR